MERGMIELENKDWGKLFHVGINITPKLLLLGQKENVQ
jgi:hypothetical protein